MKMLHMLLILCQMLKIRKHILILLSLLENQFLDSLKGLVLYSLRCKFFTLLVEIDTATILMGDCLKYCNNLGGDPDGLDDAML